MHYPETKETQRVLSQKVAAVHAQTVIEKFKSLTCPVEQKTELIDEIRHRHEKEDGA